MVDDSHPLAADVAAPLPLGPAETRRRERADRAFVRSARSWSVKVDNDGLAHRGQSGSWRGARAEVSFGDAGDRFTMSRLALLGPFALAAKKKTGHGFLIIESPDFQWAIPFPPKRMASAYKFVAAFNTKAKAVARGENPLALSSARPIPSGPWVARHKVLTGFGVVLVTGMIGNGISAGGSHAKDVAASKPAQAVQVARATPTSSEAKPVAPKPAQAPAAVQAPAVPTMTTGQQNAVDKAEDYLSYDAFSRTGLIKQLEFEQFSAADAAYAVDHIHANWKNEAAQKAKDYLGYDSFSHGGLVAQLKFEGFTAAQAEYGARAAGL
jgi:hypothetical protein